MRGLPEARPWLRPAFTRSASLPPPKNRISPPRPSGPSLALSHTRLDLGEGKPGEQLEGSFTVTNQGSEPLEFTLSASCGCAFVRPMGGRLKPGESRKVSLGIRLPSTPNSEKSTQVLVRSNDPRRPQVTCVATGRAPAPWEVSHTHINFGYVLREQLENPPRMQLEVRRGRGRNGMPASVVRTRVAGEAYEVRSQLCPDGTLLFEVRLRRGLSDGRYSSVLELGHADDPAAISIPLDAEVGPSVELVPSFVYVTKGKANGAYRPVQVVAIGRRRRLVMGQLMPVSWHHGLRWRHARRPSGRLWRHAIELAPGTCLPREGLRLELKHAGANERLQFTLLPDSEGVQPDAFQQRHTRIEEG